MQFNPKTLIGALGSVEWVLSSRHTPKYAPVFIVGPPRSGTTVVYQAICHRLHVAYPSNLIVGCNLDRAPRLYRLCWLALRWLDHSSDSSFQSDCGETKGYGGPSEASMIWRRWFPNETQYTTDGYFNERQIRQMRACVANVEALFDGPFVNKNIKHSVRIRALCEIFPRALFIEVHRDPVMNAQSIYLTRGSKPYRDRKWFSVKPREVDQLLGLDALEQAVAQVFYVRRNIAEDRCRVGARRFFTVPYEAFCADPRRWIRDIAAFMNEGGAPTTPNGRLPETFECSRKQRLDDVRFGRLQQLVDQYFTPPPGETSDS